MKELSGFTRRWRQEKLGLSMIVAALAVILVILSLMWNAERASERDHLHQHGLSLVRILSQVPYGDYQRDSRLLLVLQQGQDRSSFAYAAVTDQTGQALQQITAPDVQVPPAVLASEPMSWVGERDLELPGHGGVLEYYAPLFTNGDLAGQVRIAFFQPRVGLHEIPFLATPALLIFMLVPLFYFLMRRQTKPLAAISDKLNDLAQKVEVPRVEIGANAELSAFMNQFGNFLENARNRLGELESDRQGLEVSTKLLSYQRARIEAVLECLPDGVLVLDETGEATIANQRACRVLDQSRETLVGKRVPDWCKDEELVAFLAQHEGRGKRGYRDAAYVMRPPNLQDTHIAVCPHPLFSHLSENNIMGTLVVFKDVTAEMLAKRVSSEFVSHMAHELKAPLNTLALYSEMLQSEDGAEEEVRIEAANVVHDEVERLNLLIQNILSITKIESGTLPVERHRAKLRDLLEDAFETCKRTAADKNRRFVLDLPRDLAPISLDKGLLRIALNNLLTNAIKYTDQGGEITLAAEEDDQSIRITVSDDGIGISDDDKAGIFDKFMRSERDEVRARTGHGLGLSLARQIVVLHQGTLSVDSTLGAGSAFTIELSKEQGFMKEAM